MRRHPEPDPHPGADPAAIHWRTTRLRMVGADPLVVRDRSYVRALLRPFMRIGELLASPGRFAVGVELTVVDGQLDATLVLSAGAESPASASSEISAMTRAVRGMLTEPPVVYRIEVDHREPRRVPVNGLRIRQATVEVSDEHDTATAVSRLERAVDAWGSLVRVLADADEPLVLRTCLLSTRLTPADEAALEAEASASRRIIDRHDDELLGLRARRVLATIMDVAESFHGPVMLADIVLASDNPIPEGTARAVALALTTEFDVSETPERADMATSTVAGRRRYVGGFQLASMRPAELERVFTDNLPAVGDLVTRDLADLVSVTEVGLLVRWPLPAGGPLPGIPTEAEPPVVRGPELVDGLDVGVDPEGRRVHVPVGHTHVSGGTGAGKSTFLAALVMAALATGLRVVVLDGHERLARGLHAWAVHQGFSSVLPGDGRTFLRLLSSASKTDPGRMRLEVARVLDGLVSMWPDEYSGPRFRQLAAALLRIAGHVPHLNPMADIRDLVDGDVLGRVARIDGVDTADVAGLRRMLGDQGDTVGWLVSKFDVLASDASRRLFAGVGDGTAIEEVLNANDLVAIPLGGGRVTADEARLGGHLAMAQIIGGLLAGPARPTLVVIDEVQRFGGHHLSTLLTEGRKFDISVAAAHQFTGQLDGQVRAALLDNASTIVAFRNESDQADIALRLGIDPRSLSRLPSLSGVLSTVTDGGRVSTTVRVPVPDLPAGPEDAPVEAPAASGLLKAAARSVGPRSSALADLLIDPSV